MMTAFDKKKSKRKKDGVFYTPEYITRYIVENTLGKLCETKKKELFGSEALASPINPKKLTKEEKETLAKLYEYRDFLLNLKILDPACGSGAFLNQALEFLIREHKNVDDYRRSYENEMLSLYDIEANILEHNLYGVDINEDAVEIARLSLWLRTAQSGRTLTNSIR
jgi:type II restriction/modification system DNA methylase subunit YeeA